MNTYKLMTCNLRTQAGCDGINQFTSRKEYAIERLHSYSPDVIGFQEIQPMMYNYLVDALDDYVIVGGGRGEKYDNEAVCIAFKRNKFYLYDCETFWLSATPNKPGSRYTGDQSVCPRICTWVTLKPRDGMPFRFYNVHTDHEGHVARVLASNQVLQKISENNSRAPMKSFITGDFNATPDDLCITTMTSYTGTPLVDLSAESGGTFHAFGKREPVKIDYIFADADVKLESLTVCRDKREDGVYISDHYPVMAEVRF